MLARELSRKLGRGTMSGGTGPNACGTKGAPVGDLHLTKEDLSFRSVHTNTGNL